MDFNKDKPEKSLSDAELIELRTNALLADLKNLRQEVKDFYEKQQAASAMQRKLLEESQDIPFAKSESQMPSESEKKKDATSAKRSGKGTIKLPETSLALRVKDFLKECQELREATIKDIENAKKQGLFGLMQEREGRLMRVNESIKKLEGSLELLASEKTSDFLDAISKEVESRDKNQE